jgi:outer membrane protein OmpA-like peptidoglycan-associated protein
MDLINLIFPRAQKKILSVIPYVGGGAAWYRRARYYMDDCYYDAAKGKWINETHSRGNTRNYINADGDFAGDYDKEYRSIGYLQAGVNVDFNINRTLAVGIRANYSYFTRDYVDGRGYHKLSPSSFASKNNDGIFDVTLNLRIKFEPQSKNHVRNISSFETWEKKAEQKPCHDTVIIRHDSIIVRESFHEQEKELEQYYYVYFANNKADIDDKGLITIQQVAERLQEDTSLYAVVTGYCDNTGSNSLNYALGDRRADNVVDELAQEHGIEMERMHAGGVGKVIGRRSTASYGPNRRAAIRLVDKETFERMKYNLDDQKANRPEKEEKTVPLTESSRQEKVNVYKERMSEEVTTEKSTTLSKLARQYYDNTYCWVYIYIANKEKISNPNALHPGTKLIIPELTEKEMQITKDESLVLFSNARQQK